MKIQNNHQTFKACTPKEQLLYGCEMPWMPSDHHRLQPCTDRGAVRQLQRDASCQQWRGSKQPMTIRCEHIMQISQLEAQNTPILSCSLIQTSIDLYRYVQIYFDEPNANSVQDGLFSQNCIASPWAYPHLGGFANPLVVWPGLLKLGVAHASWGFCLIPKCCSQGSNDHGFKRCHTLHYHT